MEYYADDAEAADAEATDAMRRRERRGRGLAVNLPLFRHTLAANAIKLVVIGAGMVLMGVIMPVMYAAFGEEVGQFVESVPLLSQFSNFGGGDLFPWHGTVAMGFSHPFTLLLLGIMAVAFPALAIAGERETGTLEVTLSRPISRHGLYLTLFVAGVLFVALLVGVLVLTTVVTMIVVGKGDEIPLANQAPALVRGLPAVRGLHVAGLRRLGRVGPRRRRPSASRPSSSCSTTWPSPSAPSGPTCSGWRTTRCSTCSRRRTS